MLVFLSVLAYLIVGFIGGVAIHVFDGDSLSEDDLREIYLTTMFVWPLVAVMALCILPKFLITRWISRLERFKKERAEMKQKEAIEKSRIEREKVFEENEKKKVKTLLPNKKSLETIE